MSLSDQTSSNDRSLNVHPRTRLSGRRLRTNRDGPLNRTEDCEVASPR